MRGNHTKRMTVVRDEAGFTIVEVVVAVSILLTGLVSLLGLFNDSRDQNATGERTEIAVMQAEQAMEELRGVPYPKLMLSAGAVDPTAGQRVVSAGAQFRVKPDLTEPLVYYTTEGKPLADAWVEPTTEVSIGTDEAPLQLTIHRFVTWRDEECRVAGLGPIGSQLPTRIQQTGTAVTALVNSITSAVLGILNPTIGNKANALKSRVSNLTARLDELSGALAGVSQLDLCDANLTALGDLQRLDRLAAQLPVLNPLVGTLKTALDLCLPILCNQSQVSSSVDQVNAQLNCMFNSTSSSGDSTYLNGLRTGVDNLAADLSNTVKNSKRVTVAVVVEPRAGVAPINPVWISSVVRDPSAGLLTSGGASCGA